MKLIVSSEYAFITYVSTKLVLSNKKVILEGQFLQNSGHHARTRPVDANARCVVEVELYKLMYSPVPEVGGVTGQPRARRGSSTGPET